MMFLTNKTTLTLILMLIVATNCTKQDQSFIERWCYTRSIQNDPTMLKAMDGGINWGKCKPQQENEPVTYKIEIRTSQLKNSGTRAILNAQLKGDLGWTDQFVLNTSPLIQGDTSTIMTNQKNIGNISKIKLILIGNLNEQYKAETIKVVSPHEEVSFDITDKMKACQENNLRPSCEYNYEVDGSIPYEVTLALDPNVKLRTDSPILIRLYGSTDETMRRTLVDNGVIEGQVISRIIDTVDIGSIGGFKLELSEAGKIKPKSLYVRNLITLQEKKWDFQDEEIVYNTPFEKKDEKNVAPKRASKAQNQNQKKEEKPESFDINDPWGGFLTRKEKSNLIELSCTQQLINPSPREPIFGFDYPTNIPNPLIVHAVCPANCHLATGTVIGYNIHPKESPICLSAIVDGAISAYGGVVAISIVPGVDQYDLPPKYPTKIGKIQIISDVRKNNMKSYIVSKIDNPDIVDKDIRILDAEGKPSNEGRIEIRVEGRWGTICAMGNSRLSAQRLCRDIDYFDGEWLPNDGSNPAKGFCKTFKGKDYCGAEFTRIWFSNIECLDKDKTFNDCNKEIANQINCTHDHDAIIRCFNNDYTKEPHIPEYTVKLEVSQTSADQVKTGRVEVYKNNSYNPVCGVGLNDEAAKVICIQMGFEDGKVFVASEGSDISYYQLPKDSPRPIALQDIKCQGTEAKLGSCQFKDQNIACQHDNDAVISCMGNGDETGKSQYEIPVFNLRPNLGKLGLYNVQANCSTKGSNPIFRGDSGSIYMVTCPAFCEKSEGSIWGTGIYTDDSNVCLVALHAGWLKPNKSGSFIFTKFAPQKYFRGSTVNGIRSSEYSGDWVISFGVFPLNTGWKNMNQLFNANMNGRSFIEQESVIILKEENEQKLNNELAAYTSFIEESSESRYSQNGDTGPISKFVYQWWLDPVAKNNNIVQEITLTETNIYGIITSFRLDELEPKSTACIFCTGCGGTNIVIGETGSIIIGDYCNSDNRLDTFFNVPLNKSIFLIVSSTSFKVEYAISVEHSSEVVSGSFDRNVNVKTGHGQIGIGLDIDKSKNFKGRIDMALITEKNFDISKIKEINSYCQSLVRNVLGLETTTDGRQCISPCTDSALPSDLTPPKEARPYLDDNSIVQTNDNGRDSNSNENGNKNKNSDSAVVVVDQVSNIISVNPNDVSKLFSDDIGTKNEKQADQIKTIELACSDTFIIFNKLSPNTIVRVRCPNCDNFKGVLFGQNKFPESNNICTSALFAGIIEPKSSSTEFIVQILKKEKNFMGGPGPNNMFSGNLIDDSPAFVVKKADALKQISCTDTAESQFLANLTFSQKTTVRCPANCSRSRCSIYGVGTYTSTSSICCAALHSGAINDLGNEVEILIRQGLQSYEGAKGFAGLVSKTYGYYNRAFEFVGEGAGINYAYAEKFSGNFLDNWKILRNNGSSDLNSNTWSYYDDSEFNHSTGKQNEIRKTIRHTGSIKVNKPFEYGSWITLNNSEWVNGKLRFSFNIFQGKKFAVLFRYKSENNYYAVEFDPNSSSNNVIIYKKSSGVETKGAKSIVLMISTWYDVVISLNFTKFSVFVKQESSKAFIPVFEDIEMSGIESGSFGFAVNDVPSLLISNIFVDNKFDHLKDAISLLTTRSCGVVLDYDVHKKLNQRKRWCKENSNLNSDLCLKDFCALISDKTFNPVVENILNFNCYKQCRRQDLAQTEVSIPKIEWIPKVGENIDFNSDNSWVAAVVKSVDTVNRDTINLVTVFEDMLGNKTNKVIKFDKKLIQPCGSQLSKRKDCV